MNRLALDAPTGELELEEESLDPDGYQHFLDHEARLCRHRITTAAVHRGAGVVAADTDLVLTTGSPDLVFQWGTLVLPEHRGQRLGLAVKVANLRPRRPRPRTASCRHPERRGQPVDGVDQRDARLRGQRGVPRPQEGPLSLVPEEMNPTARPGSRGNSVFPC